MFIASFNAISIFSNSLFTSILRAWNILAFVFGQPGITSLKSVVVLNFLFLLCSTILADILLLHGSSEYLRKISLKSSCLYELTISAAVLHLLLSNLISRGHSSIKLNHLSASSKCREDNQRSK